MSTQSVKILVMPTSPSIAVALTHFPAPVSTCIPGDVPPCKQTAVLFGPLGFGLAAWSESAFFGCKGFLNVLQTYVEYSREFVQSTVTLLDPTSALIPPPCSGTFRAFRFASARAGLVGRVP